MFSDIKLMGPSDPSFVGSFIRRSTAYFEIAHDLFIKIYFRKMQYKMDEAQVYKFISSMQIYRSCTSTIYRKTKCHQDMFCIHYCFKSHELYSLFQPFLCSWRKVTFASG